MFLRYSFFRFEGVLGPVHTMPDKFAKHNFIVMDTASIHTNMHKKIHENGTFWKRSPEWNNLKMILFLY